MLSVILLAYVIHPSNQARRWMNPCGATRNSHDLPIDIFSNNGKLSERSLQQSLSPALLAEIIDSMNLILERLRSLKRKVKELKELYVRKLAFVNFI